MVAGFVPLVADIKAAPVWDGDREAYCGVLTMSDYMFVMFHYFQLGNPGAAMSEHSCLSWRGALVAVRPVRLCVRYSHLLFARRHLA